MIKWLSLQEKYMDRLESQTVLLQTLHSNMPYYNLHGKKNAHKGTQLVSTVRMKEGWISYRFISIRTILNAYTLNRQMMN